jgi:hypothetical protein
VRELEPFPPQPRVAGVPGVAGQLFLERAEQREWGAELVAHVGEELGLGPVDLGERGGPLPLPGQRPNPAERGREVLGGQLDEPPVPAVVGRPGGTPTASTVAGPAPGAAAPAGRAPAGETTAAVGAPAPGTGSGSGRSRPVTPPARRTRRPARRSRPGRRGRPGPLGWPRRPARPPGTAPAAGLRRTGRRRGASRTAPPPPARRPRRCPRSWSAASSCSSRSRLAASTRSAVSTTVTSTPPGCPAPVGIAPQPKVN